MHNNWSYDVQARDHATASLLLYWVLKKTFLYNSFTAVFCFVMSVYGLDTNFYINRAYNVHWKNRPLEQNNLSFLKKILIIWRMIIISAAMIISANMSLLICPCIQGTWWLRWNHASSFFMWKAVHPSNLRQYQERWPGMPILLLIDWFCFDFY